MPYLVPKSLTERKKGHIKLTTEKLNRRLENKEGRKDFMEQLSKGEPGLSFNELLANAGTLIVAGSETTATAMAGLTYFLLLNPEKLQKVVQEIRSAFASEDEISMATINCLSYLGVCIDEALRLYPPVGFGVPRRVPGHGMMLNGKWVPGNVC
jgi:cytochrome P450